jgi:hypothetical protein
MFLTQNSYVTNVGITDNPADVSAARLRNVGQNRYRRVVSVALLMYDRQVCSLTDVGQTGL